jgi:transcription initiation factor TFIIIB Brf1 subunit/transcription initiation factor TFIIB
MIAIRKKCPYCGSSNVIIDEPNNALICNNCGKVSYLKKTEKKEEESKKEKLTLKDMMLSLIFFIIGLVVFFVLFSLLGVAKLIQPLFSFLATLVVPLGPIGQFIVSMAIPLVVIFWAIFAIILPLFKLRLKGIYAVIRNWNYSIWFIDIALIFIYAGWYGYQNFPGAQSQVECLKLAATGQMDYFKCMTQVGITSEQAQKKGGYEAIQINLGSKHDSAYIVPSVYGNYPYTLPVTIVNPNPSIVVEDVVVSGGFYNDTDNKVNRLIADFCSKEADHCKLEREPLTVVLDTEANKPVVCSNDFLDLKVEVKYSYSVEGQNGFVIARTADDLNSAPEQRATTGIGPLDVTIYFAPSNYVKPIERSKEAVEEPKIMRMFISIKNKADGEAAIKSIKIEQLNKIKGFELSKCYTPLFTEFKGTDYKCEGIECYFTKEQLYQCWFTISPDLELKDRYITIPFIVTVNYIYSEEVTKRVSVDRSVCIVPAGAGETGCEGEDSAKGSAESGKICKSGGISYPNDCETGNPGKINVYYCKDNKCKLYANYDCDNVGAGYTCKRLPGGSAKCSQ